MTQAEVRGRLRTFGAANVAVNRTMPPIHKYEHEIE